MAAISLVARDGVSTAGPVIGLPSAWNSNELITPGFADAVTVNPVYKAIEYH